MAEVTERDIEAAYWIFFLCGSLGDFDAACAFLAEWREARLAETESDTRRARDERDRERAAREKAEGELEQTRVQLAGCGVAAYGGTKDPAKCGDYGWSDSYQATLNLRLKHDALEARLRAVIEAADAVLSALNACESNRGCFSTAGQHDYRCPYLSPSIAVVPESCECGRTLLDEALAHYRKVRDDGK